MLGLGLGVGGAEGSAPRLLLGGEDFVGQGLGQQVLLEGEVGVPVADGGRYC